MNDEKITILKGNDYHIYVQEGVMYINFEKFTISIQDVDEGLTILSKWKSFKKETKLTTYMLAAYIEMFCGYRQIIIEIVNRMINGNNNNNASDTGIYE